MIVSRPRCAAFALMLVLAGGSARAMEGMWMPAQVPDLAAALHDLGFEGDPAAFSDLTGHPMGAVVSLGFCTASFVSPEGLLITNHHCAVGALQYNSTPERNLLDVGFLARTRGEELSNGPGFRVWVTTAIREVTDEVSGALPADMTDDRRDRAIRRKVNEVTKACEETADRCVVRSFFGGLAWYELRQTEIEDVRLVYAPDDGIGVFGGETDNFSWPRHTGDWTFMRAYVGPDGEPAPYSEDNVPYRPKTWLRVSPAGADPGELVVVAGYPGTTYRHRTLGEVRETVEWNLPRNIRIAEGQRAILRELAASDEDLAIKVESRIRGLDNGLKYRRGVLSGLIGAGALARKEAQESALRAWIAAEAEREARYGDVVTAMDDLLAERVATRARDAERASLGRASRFLGSAYTMYRLAVEAEKPDLDRRAGYRDRDRDDIRRREERAQRTLDARVDRALLRDAMLRAAALPSDQRIAALDEAVGIDASADDAAIAAAIDRFLDAAYGGTRMGELEFRLDLLDRDLEALERMDDPFVRLARALHPARLAYEAAEERRDGVEWRLRPRLAEALLAMQEGRVAPDANGTLRVTFGLVEGTEVRDGLAYLPQTRLRGLRAKHTGEGDFDAPDALIEAIDAVHDRSTATPFLARHLADVPVNFLSSVDTTGGNSGSPTLNARGELVGVLFDGTWESIAADYVFDPEINRSIHVDVRYILWVMDAVDGAHDLLRELGIDPEAAATGGASE